MRWLCLMALAAAAAQTTGAFLVPPDCAYGPPRCTPLDTEAAVTQAANTEEEFCVCQPTTTEPRIVAAARGACYVPGLRTAYRHALPQPEGSARSAAACAPMLVERRKCRRQVPCPGAAAGHSGSRAARDAGDGSTGGTLSASTSSSDDDDVWQIPLLGVALGLVVVLSVALFVCVCFWQKTCCFAERNNEEAAKPGQSHRSSKQPLPPPVPRPSKDSRSTGPASSHRATDAHAMEAAANQDNRSRSIVLDLRSPNGPPPPAKPQKRSASPTISNGSVNRPFIADEGIYGSLRPMSSSKMSTVVTAKQATPPMLPPRNHHQGSNKWPAAASIVSSRPSSRGSSNSHFRTLPVLRRPPPQFGQSLTEDEALLLHQQHEQLQIQQLEHEPVRIHTYGSQRDKERRQGSARRGASVNGGAPAVNVPVGTAVPRNDHPSMGGGGSVTGYSPQAGGHPTQGSFHHVQQQSSSKRRRAPAAPAKPPPPPPPPKPRSSRQGSALQQQQQPPPPPSISSLQTVAGRTPSPTRGVPHDTRHGRGLANSSGASRTASSSSVLAAQQPVSGPNSALRNPEVGSTLPSPPGGRPVNVQQQQQQQHVHQPMQPPPTLQRQQPVVQQPMPQPQQQQLPRPPVVEIQPPQQHYSPNVGPYTDEAGADSSAADKTGSPLSFADNEYDYYTRSPSADPPQPTVQSGGRSGAAGPGVSEFWAPRIYQGPRPPPLLSPGPDASETTLLEGPSYASYFDGNGSLIASEGSPTRQMQARSLDPRAAYSHGSSGASRRRAKTVGSDRDMDTVREESAESSHQTQHHQQHYHHHPDAPEDDGAVDVMAGDLSGGTQDDEEEVIDIADEYSSPGHHVYGSLRANGKSGFRMATDPRRRWANMDERVNVAGSAAEDDGDVVVLSGSADLDGDEDA